MKQKSILILAMLIACTLAIPAHASVVDFNNLQSYIGQPAGPGAIMTPSADGQSATFTNNIWMSHAMPITVTAASTLSFYYMSTAQPEIAGIGFDTDNTFLFANEENAFKVWGVQDSWQINDLTSYDEMKTDEDGFAYYTVRLADYFTIGTTFNYLFFFNDDDGVHGGDGLSQSTFSNVSVSATPIPGAVWLLGSGILGLIGAARIRRMS